MSLTALFAELAIVGLQAAIWMVLAVMALTGPEVIDLNALSRPVVWIPLVAFMYVIGIAVDRAIDQLIFRRLEHRIRRDVICRYSGKDVPLSRITEEWDLVRLNVLSSQKGLHRMFDYTRSRLRIMRASSVNILLIAVGATFNIVRWKLLPTSGAVVCGGLGFVVSALCFYAWWVLASGYNHSAYRLALKTGESPPPD